MEKYGIICEHVTVFTITVLLKNVLPGARERRRIVAGVDDQFCSADPATAFVLSSKQAGAAITKHIVTVA